MRAASLGGEALQRSPEEHANFRASGFKNPACPAAATGGSYESMDLSGSLCLIPNLSGLVKFDGA